MASQMLNILIVAEYFVCVFRNYYQKSTTVKKLIVSCIIVDTILLLACGVYCGYYMNIHSYIGISNALVLFHIQSQICSIVASWQTITRTLCFKTYYQEIISTHELLIRDETYKTSLKIFFWSSGICFSLVTFVRTAVGVWYTVKQMLKQDSTADMVVFGLFKLYQTITGVRYYNEFFTYFMFIMTIYFPYRRLNAFIVKIDMKMNYSLQDREYRYVIAKDETEKWITIFKQLNLCARSLNECYYFQNLFAFNVSITRCIYLTYHILDVIIAGTAHGYRDIVSIVLALVYVIVISGGLVLAGQMIKNQSVQLIRMLARMNSKLSTGADQAAMKFVKDFLRLATTNPVEIRVLSNTFLGMYLVPACCSIVFNYVVVGLQFNHVV